MAKSILGGWGETTGPGIAQTFVQIGGFVEDSTDGEAAVEIRFRSAGTLSNFHLTIETNLVNASRLWSIRKNAASTNLNVTVPSSTTGEFEDTTDTVSIAVGDDICLMVAAGGSVGTTNIDSTGLHFDATTNTVSKWVCSSSTSFSAASTTYYNPIQGYLSTIITTTLGEDNIENEIQVAGTLKGLTAVVATNARTTSSTVRSRKNSANGAQSVSIGSSGTGVFTDTTNTDSVVAGDVCDVSFTTGTGTGTLVLYSIQTEYQTTDGTSAIINADSDPLTQSTGLTRYLAPNGYTGLATAETNTQVPVRFDCTRENLFVNVTANTTDGSGTVRTRVNGANGNCSVSIAANTTGKFEDLSGIDTVTDGDDASNYQSVSGTGTGTISYGLISSYFLTGGGGPIDMTQANAKTYSNKFITKV